MSAHPFEREAEGLDLREPDGRADLRGRIAHRLRSMRLEAMNAHAEKLGGERKRSRAEAYREIARCIIKRRGEA